MTREEFISRLQDYFIKIGIYEEEVDTLTLLNHMVVFSLSLINDKNNAIKINSKKEKEKN